ncbi:MAG: hypothetical protein IKN14_02120 [Clostridiales bacterium]|nr:hypothetical protein [Clostridiales bacterium]
MADTIKCPNCGGNLLFDADLQKLTCEFCGGAFLPEELKNDVENVSSDDAQRTDGTVEEVPDGTPEEEAKEREEDISPHVNFVCNSCGASIVSDQNTSATFCAFCGSPALVGQRLTKSFRPKYIIPFKYGRDKAVAGFFKWCKGGRYTPFGFISEKNLEKLTGLYVPFWLFDVEGDMDYEGEGDIVTSKTTGNTTVTTTKTYKITRKGRFNWKNIPLDAETRIDDDLMEAIEPFDFKDLIDYDYKYLPGFFADVYDLSDNDLSARASRRGDKYLKEEFKKTVKKYDKVRKTRDDSKVLPPKAEYALLPVWFMSYKYLGNVYHFAMNGQTGEVAGTPPVSMVKRIMLFFVLFAVFAVIAKVIVGLMLGGYVG